MRLTSNVQNTFIESSIPLIFIHKTLAMAKELWFFWKKNRILLTIVTEILTLYSTTARTHLPAFCTDKTYSCLLVEFRVKGRAESVYGERSGPRGAEEGTLWQGRQNHTDFPVLPTVRPALSVAGKLCKMSS